jgi:short-subunit dehydrogenase
MSPQHGESALAKTPVAVIVGASSGIGEALARRLARGGYRVALLARRSDKLQAVASAIEAEYGPGRARVYQHDVGEYDQAPALLQTILRDMGRVDVFVYNSGIMLPVGLEEFNFEKDRQMVDVNVLGALAWLNPVADMLGRLGSGHIVGISSVAGERGRVGSPGYNTSKAALSTFLESLRNRLTRKGVHVLTVKPGFVGTDMLKSTARTFWVISPDQAADDIFRAIRSKKQTLFTPARWGWVMLVIRNMPSFIFRRLKV